MNNLYALKITVSNFCGYKCRYCYVDTDNEDKVDLKLAFRVIDYYLGQKGKNKIIFFLGGEALLVFDLLEKLIIYSNKQSSILGKNITLFLTTSGLSLDLYKTEFLFTNNVNIGVSIDGAKKEHGINRITRKGLNSYGSTISAIKLLNKYYDDINMGYALTVDENSVYSLFKSFLYLSNLDNKFKRRNITIAAAYKGIWSSYNIKILETELKKICAFISNNIEKKDFYFYNVLSFFILELNKGNILKKGNTELHLFPDGELSLHLFKQSIFSNITDDPTKGRFIFVNKIALLIIEKSKKNKNYLNYINILKNKAIL